VAPDDGVHRQKFIVTDKPKKLSNTARALLIVAALRNDHLIAPPKLPVAAARQAVRSLLNAGFAEEVPAPIEDPAYAWRTSDDVGVLMIRATALGLAGLAEDEGMPSLSIGPAAKAAEPTAGTAAAESLERRLHDTGDAGAVLVSDKAATAARLAMVGTRRAVARDLLLQAPEALLTA
jgi:hypothetical protein